MGLGTWLLGKAADSVSSAAAGAVLIGATAAGAAIAGGVSLIPDAVNAAKKKGKKQA